MIKIQVNRVPEQGLSEHDRLDPAALDMEREDLHVREPLTVDTFVTKVDRELMVKAEIRYQLHLCCARCLEEFAVPARTEAFFSYQVEPTDIVDITNDVRQEVMLTYPMVPLCQPSCKGLCGVCGKNLNTSSCAHAGAGAPQGQNQGVDDGASEA